MHLQVPRDRAQLRGADGGLSMKVFSAGQTRGIETDRKETDAGKI
jgi:hypothetical protein